MIHIHLVFVPILAQNSPSPGASWGMSVMKVSFTGVS